LQSEKLSTEKEETDCRKKAPFEFQKSVDFLRREAYDEHHIVTIKIRPSSSPNIQTKVALSKMN